jgi:CspA family cold shock protein
MCVNLGMKKRGGRNMVGQVKWFNNEKGYGFIKCSGMDDIFVHYSAIKMDGYKTLGEGVTVEFKLIETSKGLQAVDVVEKELTSVV